MIGEQLYCIVSFGAQVGTLSSADYVQLEQPFMARLWARAVTGTYIVKVEDGTEWTVLKDSLIAASQGIGNRVIFVISPPMPTTLGRLNGLLPPALWEKVNSVAYE